MVLHRFRAILSLGRRKKLVGIAEQYQYNLRDESIHLNSGIDVMNQFKIENPQLWSPGFQAEVSGLLARAPACELEVAYGRATMPTGMLGLNADQCGVYVLHHRPQVRADRVGAPRHREPVSLDERDGGPDEGEQLLRGQGDRIPDRRWAGLGLIPLVSAMRSARTGRSCAQRARSSAGEEYVGWAGADGLSREGGSWPAIRLAASRKSARCPPGVPTDSRPGGMAGPA